MHLTIERVTHIRVDVAQLCDQTLVVDRTVFTDVVGYHALQRVLREVLPMAAEDLAHRVDVA